MKCEVTINKCYKKLCNTISINLKSIFEKYNN